MYDVCAMAHCGSQMTISWVHCLPPATLICVLMIKLRLSGLPSKCLYLLSHLARLWFFGGGFGEREVEAGSHYTTLAGLELAIDQAYSDLPASAFPLLGLWVYVTPYLVFSTDCLVGVWTQESLPSSVLCAHSL